MFPFPRTLSSLYIFTSALSLLQITFAAWAILSFGFGINTESSSAWIHSFVAVSAIVALSLVYKTRRRRINSKKPRTIYEEIQIITFFMAFWFAVGVMSAASFTILLSTSSESALATQRECTTGSFARLRCAILGINAFLPFVHCLICASSLPGSLDNYIYSLTPSP
ncbi:hypothetical protein R3P38DRAFT_2940764 [Favolaschia claudopus]|uniref:Uncharacterized protein n=1 Tax=Favolaschia claudopus TaxID=2862362 RepID=A0AAW0BP90_9AGAR